MYAHRYLVTLTLPQVSSNDFLQRKQPRPYRLGVHKKAKLLLPVEKKATQNAPKWCSYCPRFRRRRRPMCKAYKRAHWRWIRRLHLRAKCIKNGAGSSCWRSQGHTKETPNSPLIRNFYMSTLEVFMSLHLKWRRQQVEASLNQSKWITARIQAWDQQVIVKSARAFIQILVSFYCTIEDRESLAIKGIDKRKVFCYLLLTIWKQGLNHSLCCWAKIKARQTMN